VTKLKRRPFPRSVINRINRYSSNNIMLGAERVAVLGALLGQIRETDIELPDIPAMITALELLIDTYTARDWRGLAQVVRHTIEDLEQRSEQRTDNTEVQSVASGAPT
jgi:hypothetical protein